MDQSATLPELPPAPDAGDEAARAEWRTQLLRRLVEVGVELAEAIGRRTPVIVAPSLNQPLLDHPQAQASLRILPAWNVIVVPPVDMGDGPRLAPTERLLDAVGPYVQRRRS